MSQPSTIAIDGLAGSGKSTAGALLAEKLGYLYFDTGVMYRAVTWAVLDRDVDPNDVEAVSELAENLIIDVEAGGPNDGRQCTVLADGRDVTWAIREGAVETRVSLVSSYPRVRSALTAQQRRIASTGSVVMVGRDIGTVVLPNADIKFFLRASSEERARRRYKQLLAQNKTVNYDDILAAVVRRDVQDQQNPVSPAVPAQDALVVDTDRLTIDQVFNRLMALMQKNSN